MSEHRARIVWGRTSADFKYDTYTRDHLWRMEGVADIAASASPEYRGSNNRVDPEQALVASLSSCHMLSFLAIAARRRHVVDAYEDAAVGVMTKNAKGKLFVSHCTLRPRIVWGGAAPPDEEIARLHHLAHEECFIANSVLTEITVEPAG